MVSAVFLIDIYMYSRSLSVRAFVADFPSAAPEFHQRTHHVRFKNLGTTDKKLLTKSSTKRFREYIDFLCDSVYHKEKKFSNREGRKYGGFLFCK